VVYITFCEKCIMIGNQCRIRLWFIRAIYRLTRRPTCIDTARKQLLITWRQVRAGSALSKRQGTDVTLRAYNHLINITVESMIWTALCRAYSRNLATADTYWPNYDVALVLLFLNCVLL